MDTGYRGAGVTREPEPVPGMADIGGRGVFAGPAGHRRGRANRRPASVHASEPDDPRAEVSPVNRVWLARGICLAYGRKKMMKMMIRIVTATLLMIVVYAPPVFADQAAIARAIASEHRTDADRKRDARSKPAVILGLLDLHEGQAVADILGGGGYYSVLLAGVVGPEGKVILQNNTPYSRFSEKRNQERFGNNQVPGLVLLKSEVDDLKLEPNSLDAALMVMSYHDLYFYSEDRGWGHTDVPLFFAQVHAALKPGGKLLIVDHAAVDGTGSSAAQNLHRIDEAFTKKDVESNGFRFVTSSDALRNPRDDRTKLVFDPSIRGKTDRFILLFERE